MDEEDVAPFEDKHIDLLNSRLIQIAEDFGVEPRRLLSHVLLFDIPTVLMTSGTAVRDTCHTQPETAARGTVLTDAVLVDNPDRKIWGTLSKYKLKNIADDVLAIMDTCDEDSFEEAKEKIIKYLETMTE